MQKKSLPMKVKHSCYRCCERENTRFSPESTFPYAVLGSLKVIDDYVVILLRIRIIQDASKSVTSQGAFYSSKGEYNEQGSHTHFAIRLGHDHVAAYPWSHQLCRLRRQRWSCCWRSFGRGGLPLEAHQHEQHVQCPTNQPCQPLRQSLCRPYLEGK